MNGRSNLSEIPQEVPLFPVPEHVLLPGFPQPYPIFESRYMVMLGDLAKLRIKDRWIAVPRMVASYGSHYRGRPQCHSLAVLGQVVGVRSVRKQHVEMTVMGLTRVELEEVNTKTPYRQARWKAVEDRFISDADLQRQVERLLQASVDLMTCLGPMASGLEGLLEKHSDPRLLLYRLGSVLLQDPDRRQQLLAERSFERRVELVLAAMTDLMSTALFGSALSKDLIAA